MVDDMNEDIAEPQNVAEYLLPIEIEEMKQAIQRWQADVATSATQYPHDSAAN